MPHDERASDVWSLGVSQPCLILSDTNARQQITMYEVLIGRTPFEADEKEQFDTADELVVYHERTKKGVWVGQWFMPHGMSD